jgi:hypothetical protein
LLNFRDRTPKRTDCGAIELVSLFSHCFKFLSWKPLYKKENTNFICI